jgi:uncharacterized protein YjbJ (UPF0337 family)
MGEMKDKAEGKFKEAAGTVTGNDDQKAEGQAQQGWGNAQGAANKVKDSVGSALDNATSDDRDSTNP